MTTKNFGLGAVLTVATARMLCEMDELYDILGHLTGETLFTHQLPRAGLAAREPVLNQHPQLREVQVPDDLHDEETAKAWVAKQVEIYGAELPIAPLDPGVYDPKDPLAELFEMRDKVRAHEESHE